MNSFFNFIGLLFYTYIYAQKLYTYYIHIYIYYIHIYTYIYIYIHIHIYILFKSRIPSFIYTYISRILQQFQFMDLSLSLSCFLFQLFNYPPYLPSKFTSSAAELAFVSSFPQSLSIIFDELALILTRKAEDHQLGEPQSFSSRSLALLLNSILYPYSPEVHG